MDDEREHNDHTLHDPGNGTYIHQNSPDLISKYTQKSKVIATSEHTVLGAKPLDKPLTPSSLMRLIKPVRAFLYPYLFSGERIESLVILTSMMSAKRSRDEKERDTFRYRAYLQGYRQFHQDHQLDLQPESDASLRLDRA